MARYDGWKKLMVKLFDVLYQGHNFYPKRKSVMINNILLGEFVKDTESAEWLYEPNWLSGNARRLSQATLWSLLECYDNL